MYANVANILGQFDLENENSFFTEIHFVYHPTMKQDEKNVNAGVSPKSK